MSITSYPIVTAYFSVVLPTGLPTELTLYNLSTTETLNINDSTNGSGFPLSPGASVSWDAGKPLYASCATSATLVVMDNGGTISNPATLAKLIVSSGLGQSVADAVAISGAPSIDSPNAFPQYTGGPTGINKAVYDISRYQSAHLYLFAAESPPNAAHFWTVNVQFWATADTGFSTGVVLRTVTATVCDSANTYWTLPAIGKTMTVTVAPLVGPAASAQVTLNVTGSFRATEEEFNVQNAGSSQPHLSIGSVFEGETFYGGAVPASSTWSDTIDFRAGVVRMTMLFVGAIPSPGMEVKLLDASNPNSNYSLGGYVLASSTGNTLVAIEADIRYRQPRLFIWNKTTAAQTVYTTLTFRK